MNAIFTALVDEHAARTLRSQFNELKPSVTRGSFGPVIVIRRGSNRLYLYKGMRFERVFGVATGQSVYPTPLGRWHDRRQVAQPVVVPAELGVGQGREADPAGPGQPARHALDGPVGERRRHPRHARRRLDRLLGLARLHPDAHPRRGVALQPRDRRHARSSSSPREMTAARLKLGAQALAVGAVPGLLALLSGSVVAGHAARRPQIGQDRRPNFTLSRARRARRRSSSPRCAGRSSCSTSGPRGATRASRRRRRSQAAAKQLVGKRVVVLGVDVNDFDGRRAQVRAQVRAHLPARPRQPQRRPRRSTG